MYANCSHYDHIDIEITTIINAFIYQMMSYSVVNKFSKHLLVMTKFLSYYNEQIKLSLCYLC